MNDDLYNLIGMLGPVLFLWAYAMVTLGLWSGMHVRLHVLNLLGAIAILISLIRFWNLPVFILEICWGAISIYGIINSLRHKKKPAPVIEP